MRYMLAVCAVLPLFGFETTVCAEVTESSPATKPVLLDTARYAKLSRAIRADQAGLRRRAIVEFGRTIERPDAQDQLLTFIFRAPLDLDRKDWILITQSLSAGAPGLVSRLIPACRENQEVFDRDLDYILQVLGTYGPAAADACPLLLEQLSRVPVAESRGKIRVVLANIGCQPGQIAPELRAAVGARSPEGKGAVSMMAAIEPGIWADVGIVDKLVTWLSEDTVQSGSGLCLSDIESAVMALGKLGERAKGAVAPVQDLERRHPEWKALCYLVVAAIDPVQRVPSVRAAMPLLDDRRGTLELATWLPPQLVGEIGRLLMDKDAEVARGALLMTAMLGPRARGAVPHLLDIVVTSSVEISRARAAIALRCAGEESVIPTLLRILQKERVRSVRKELQETIRILRLEPPADDSTGSELTEQDLLPGGAATRPSNEPSQASQQRP